MTDKEGQSRPMSLTYVDRLSYQLSVYVGSETNLQTLLERYPGEGVVEFPVSVVRKTLELPIVRDPLPDEPSHCLIDPSPDGKQAREFVKVAQLLVAPDEEAYKARMQGKKH